MFSYPETLTVKFSLTMVLVGDIGDFKVTLGFY